MFSSDETYILLSAVRYQLPRRTYGSFIICNHILNNIERIDTVTLQQLAREIRNEIEAGRVSAVDATEWLRAANKIQEFLRKD